jgi:ATP-dependent DNA helicase RecQ
VEPASEMIAQASHERVKMLNLKDVDLGYAGSFQQQHPIHGALQRLQPGDQLKMVDVPGNLLLLFGHTPIVKLSKTANARWKYHLENILAIEVIALVQWGRSDSELKYQKRFKIETWEILLVELRYVGSINVL